MTARRVKPKAPRRRRSSAPLEQRALKRLAWLMENAGSEQAQVAAAKELLDRLPGAGAAGGAGLEDVVARLRQLRASSDAR